MNKNEKYTNGYNVFPRFGIKLHIRDKALLESIKVYFENIGSIVDYKDKAVQYKVGSIENLKIIINHFDKFPLITQKWSDFQLFKQGVELISSKEHLTENGIKKLIVIKASLNKGLSEDLKKYFLNIVPVLKPIGLNQNINNDWLSGFISGEGCFSVYIVKSKTKIGYAVWLKFSITQHIRDKLLLESLITYLDCGRVETKIYNSFNWAEFVVTKFLDIVEKIIPLLKQFPVKGEKSNDFEDFCKVAELIKNKEYLTQEGLEIIKQIKSGMNKGRYN